MEVLATHANRGVRGSLNRCRQTDERREYNYLAIADTGYKGSEALEELYRFSNGFVHLPVARHDASPHKILRYLSFLNLLKKTCTFTDLCSEVFSYCLADVRERGARPECHAAFYARACYQQRRVFA